MVEKIGLSEITGVLHVVCTLRCMAKKPAQQRRQCGSMAGYRQHSKRGEEQCDACRAARRDYMRRYRAGKVKPRGESRESRRAREEQRGGEVVDVMSPPPQGASYPAFLKGPGRKMWDEISEAYTLDPVGRAILVEACRLKDRLERFSAALAAESTLWFELGEPEELRDGTQQMQVVINSMVAEARQTQAALAIALGKIGVLKPAEERGQETDVMDEIARKRAARLAGREA